MTASTNFVSKKDLRNILGVSDTIISKWVSLGMPVNGKGHGNHYDSVACLEWLKSYWVSDALRRNQTVSSKSLEDLKVEGQEITNDMKRYQLEEIRGNTVTLTTCEDRIEKRLRPILTHLDLIPAKWSQKLVGVGSAAEGKAILTELRDRLKLDIATKHFEPASDDEPDLLVDDEDGEVVEETTSDD